jgi:hypothetical protein
MKKPTVKVIAPKISEEERQIAWEKVQKVVWKILRERDNK